MLGFSVKEVLGKNVSALMPMPIGKSHDKIVLRYFETAISTMVD